MWGLLRGACALALWRRFGVLGITRPVSVTRPPARSPEHERETGEPKEPEQLEELGDEAIISQQTAAHALQPRANVSEESRSVVITDPAERRDTEPPRHPAPKSSAEATLVIRDRRALDEMRRKILRQQRHKGARARSALYLWGGLGLAAFVLGGIVALLATDTHPESQTGDGRGSAAQGAASPAQGSPPAAKPATNGSSAGPSRTVRIDELPVEPQRKQ